jgi:molybdopterin/thiamine biosynthesis adenylyltransferase
MRNLRAYFGRVVICDCGKESVIENTPLTCDAGGNIPELLKLDPKQWWNQPQLEASRVLVIGCGAIGNEVVKNLVMMGIKNLTLIDFDDVEPHNLSRSVLYNTASLAAANSLRKVDVMKAGIHLIQSEVNVETIYGGILDPISKATGRNKKWEHTLNEDDLAELSKSHDLCVIATDGVAPKAFASQTLYRLLPIVQGAMNSTGNFGIVRNSLPLVTSCVMCPTTEDVVKLDSYGYASEYIERIRKMTGSGGCDGFIDAAGAAGFADSTSLVGSVMASQVALICMGWPTYQLTNGKEWPTPPPLWDQMQKISGRAPQLSKLVDIKPIPGAEGPDIFCI